RSQQRATATRESPKCVERYLKFGIPDTPCAVTAAHTEHPLVPKLFRNKAATPCCDFDSLSMESCGKKDSGGYLQAVSEDAWFALLTLQNFQDFQLFKSPSITTGSFFII